MMTEGEIHDALSTLAREKLQVRPPLRREMRLVEDLELDSLKRLTLAVEVENRFRICLEEEDEEEIVTVGDLVRVIGAKLAEAE